MVIENFKIEFWCSVYDYVYLGWLENDGCCRGAPPDDGLDAAAAPEDDGAGPPEDDCPPTSGTALNGKKEREIDVN